MNFTIEQLAALAHIETVTRAARTELQTLLSAVYRNEHGDLAHGTTEAGLWDVLQRSYSAACASLEATRDLARNLQRTAKTPNWRVSAEIVSCECGMCYATAECFDDGEAYICVDRAACQQRQQDNENANRAPSGIEHRGY